MDWGRAKSVLIVSFLLLNIVLGFQLYNSRWDKTASQNTAVIREETLKLLDSRNIRIAVKKVPKDTPKLRAVYSREKINHDDPVKVESPFNASTLLRNSPSEKAMEEAGIENPGAYESDAATSVKGEKRVYYQMVDDLPLFDVSLVLAEENGKITGYKQAYVEVQSGVDVQEQEVISAYTALRSLAENTQETNYSIVDIQLGYHGQKFNTETQYMLPSWRIMRDNGDIYYVQAYTGAVEQPSEKDE
ncbi:two-component system regulatory protein YycI [Gorillibacterium sp. CAU 1737]|uniref:two-component system regulatory protein YycI n=1 Tax=Gorillibacterium sp. CAU 1737 TaxID=3140362 RepID=UPI0032614300